MGFPSTISHPWWKAPQPGWCVTNTSPMQAGMVTGPIFAGLKQAIIVTVCSWVQGLSCPEGTGFSSLWYLPPVSWPLALINLSTTSPSVVHWGNGVHYRCPIYGLALHRHSVLGSVVSFCFNHHPLHKETSLMWSKSCTNWWVQRYGFRGQCDSLHQEVVDALTLEMFWYHPTSWSSSTDNVDYHVSS